MLLGAILMNNEAFVAVQDMVTAEHFFEAAHRGIFEICSQLITMGKLASPVTIKPFLPADVDICGMKLSKYLARLAAEAVTIVNCKDFAQVVRDLADIRQIGVVAEELRPRGGVSPIEQAAYGVDALDAIVSGRSVASMRAMTMPQTVARAVDAAAVAYQNEGKMVGMPYGLADLDAKMLGAQRGHLIVIAARPSMGKEQPVDTPILTPFGWSEIGNIRPGDFVFGVNGKPVRVVAVHPQGIKPSYRVVFRDGTSTECGLDHLWAVRPSEGRSRDKTIVKSLRDLMAGGLNRKKTGNRHGARWHVPMCEPVDWPAANLPIDPYCLGVLIGDGSMVNNNLRFSNPDFDSDIRHEVFRRMPDILFKEGRYGKACPYYEMQGRKVRKAFKEKLAALGLNVKSGEKFIPRQYLMASIQQRKDMLHGLMDTDGHHAKNGTTTFSTTSSKLAKDICELVRSLGGWAIVKFNDRSHHGKSVEYTVRVKTVECPFFTSRKAAGWSPRFAPSKYIWSVNFSRNVEQVCITVDADDGLYLTNDYIVTHNSAFALSISRNMAWAGHHGVFYSLEMGDIELSQRMISDEMFDEGRMTYWQIRSGRFHESVFLRIREAADRLSGLPLVIEQQPGLSVSQISARARQRKRRGKLDFIVVDHLGLIASSGRYSGSRVNEIGEMTASLKGLAKELDCAVFVLSQLNRAVEAREDKRPRMADLRESGSIEQDADVVIMLYRKAYYLERSEPPVGSAEHLVWQKELEGCHNELLLLVEKQRAGPVGSIKVFCDIGSNAIRTWHNQGEMS